MKLSDVLSSKRFWTTVGLAGGYAIKFLIDLRLIH